MENAALTLRMTTTKCRTLHSTSAYL